MIYRDKKFFSSSSSAFTGIGRIMNKCVVNLI